MRFIFIPLTDQTMCCAPFQYSPCCASATYTSCQLHEDINLDKNGAKNIFLSFFTKSDFLKSYGTGFSKKLTQVGVHSAGVGDYIQWWINTNNGVYSSRTVYESTLLLLSFLGYIPQAHRPTGASFTLTTHTLVRYQILIVCCSRSN